MNGVLTLDGKTVSFREGQTLLELARENGIQIPSLCYHRKTGQAARCRVCVVEVEGQRNLATACNTAAREGMVVRTSTERDLAARERQQANGNANVVQHGRDRAERELELKPEPEIAEDKHGRPEDGPRRVFLKFLTHRGTDHVDFLDDSF